MNKDTRNIIELGSIYGVVVILLNFFLGQFTVLIWPALGISSVVFALLIVDSLSHLTPSPEPAFHLQPRTQYDELARLQGIIEQAIGRRETQSNVIEKLRTVGLSMASARMNLSEEQFSELIDRNPELAMKIVRDGVLLSLLTGKKLNLTNVQALDDVLSRIERL